MTRILWPGGECPVAKGTRVRVWLCGTTGDIGPFVGTAYGFDWRHLEGEPHPGDIIAYEILEPDWAVEGPIVEGLLTEAVQLLSICADEAEAKEIAAFISRARAALARIRGEG